MGYGLPSGAAAAGFRVGHLRGRWDDARAHPRDGHADCTRDGADASRTSHMRGRNKWRSRRCRPPVLGCRDTALRGDPPEAAATYSPTAGGYAYAADLVAGLRKVADFEISVAAYPEVHPDAPSAAFDLDNLKRKIDAGASRAITQFFFDNSAYLRFRDAVAAVGVDTHLVPGIMPVTNFAGIRRFAERCGASIPTGLADAFEGLDDDANARQRVAEEIACNQCLDLTEHGVREFHFYTLNRAELTEAICRRLGIVTSDTPLVAGLESAR